MARQTGSLIHVTKHDVSSLPVNVATAGTRA